MRPDDHEHVSEPPLPYSQLQKVQQKLKQFIPKYNKLVEYDERLRKDNAQLREEIERFNQALIAREQELGKLQNDLTDLLALLRQIKQEERRSPALHARAFVRKRFLQLDADLLERGVLDHDLRVPDQEMLPLDIWLVSRNRFVEQIISYYTQKRERLLVIEDYRVVKQLIEIGLFPDIILTGAYDFGLDDPFHRSFFEFLEQLPRRVDDAYPLPEFFLITLSASIPAPKENVKPDHKSQIRHKYISKLHGLQVTVSEVRFFLEMRRCQPDIMEAEIKQEIHSLAEVTHVMMTVQKQHKTGLLAVFSNETPPDIRWAFLLFYLHGKLVKTEHTLESSALITAEGDIEPLEKEFIFTAFESQYQLNPPQQLFFFPLYEHAVLREMKAEVPL